MLSAIFYVGAHFFMVLSLGKTAVHTEDILAILCVEGMKADNAVFFSQFPAEKAGISDEEEIRSMVLVQSGDAVCAYFSPISCKTLAKRANNRSKHHAE